VLLAASSAISSDLVMHGRYPRGVPARNPSGCRTRWLRPRLLVRSPARCGCSGRSLAADGSGYLWICVDLAARR
jgi:hypothetical protein